MESGVGGEGIDPRRLLVGRPWFSSIFWNRSCPRVAVFGIICDNSVCGSFVVRVIIRGSSGYFID